MQKCQVSCSRSHSKSRVKVDEEVKVKGYKLLAIHGVCMCVYLIHPSPLCLSFNILQRKKKGFRDLHME